MKSNVQFIRESLELHLFFARIMKEHSFFLQIGFTKEDSNLMNEADLLRREFDRLLSEAVSLSNGVVSSDVLESGEVITQYTLKAELASAYFTGIRIPTNLTKAEAALVGDASGVGKPILEEKVFMLNDRAIRLVSDLIQFKTRLLSAVLACQIFTGNYPLLIEHILREAKLYRKIIRRLQNHEDVDLEKEAYEQETFWNRIMAEHSKFIRGLLDPTENELIDTANNFGNEFDNLTKEAIASINGTIPLENVTEDSLKATIDIKNFKEQGTQGVLNCKIKSIIIPLLGDHTIREASHYLRLLKIFKRSI